jgi:hypothetical protein
MASKIITINRFDGGVVNNGRFPSPRHAKVVTNFNVLSDPFRLVPYLSSEDGDSSATTNKIQNFCLGKQLPSDAVFGLGVKSGNPAVFYRITTSDLADSTWSSTANNSLGGTPDQDRAKLFIYYPNQDKVYFWASNTSMVEYDPDNETANQSLDLATSSTVTPTSFTRSSNAILHSKDDIVYVGIDNYIIKKNAATAWADGLTLPVGVDVVCLAEYGNYLAIATRPTGRLGKCTVYLWDRDSSLATLTQSVSWGDESLEFIEEIEGELVGISTTGVLTADIEDKVVFRRYIAGVGAVKFLELDGGVSPTVGVQVPRAITQKYRGRLYFMMTITLHGAVRHGVWSIGRNPGTREWTLVHEKTSNNDTALNNTHTLYSFINVGDYLFQAHLDNGTEKMTKTDDAVVYTGTSYFESTINPGMDAKDFFMKKRLKAISLHFERLPANGVASVKFRADSATAWASITALLSENTDNAVFKEATRFDTSGNSVLTDGREFEFRIESTGGAVITGISYEYDILKSLKN